VSFRKFSRRHPPVICIVIGVLIIIGGFEVKNDRLLSLLWLRSGRCIWWLNCRFHILRFCHMTEIWNCEAVAEIVDINLPAELRADVLDLHCDFAHLSPQLIVG